MGQMLIVTLREGIEAFLIVAIAAAYLRKTGRAALLPAVWWGTAASILLSVVLGAFLVMAPGAGALAVLWWIGAFAIVFGILEIILGFRLKGVNDRLAHRRA